MASGMRWDRLREQRISSPSREITPTQIKAAFRKWHGKWCICTNAHVSSGDTLRVTKANGSKDTFTLGPLVHQEGSWSFYRPSTNLKPQPGNNAGRQDSEGR